MTSEIVLFDGDVRDQLALIERAIDSAAALPHGPERRAAFATAQRQFTSLQKSIQNFNVELRGIRNPEQRQVYETIQREHLQAQKALEARITAAQAADPDTAATSEVAATHQNYNRAIEIQKDGLELLRMATRHGATAEEIGSKTQQMLVEQTERIEAVQSKSKELVSNIKRAQKDVLWFMRTATTDKCLILIFGALVLGVAGIILWHVWLGKYLEERGYNPLRLNPLVTLTPLSDDASPGSDRSFK